VIKPKLSLLLLEG